VSCTATDDYANSTTNTFTVTVEDTTAPELTLTDITAEATSSAGATVTFSPTATDIVDGSVPVTCNWASGDVFPLGTTTVDCSATDAAGNTANGSFTVTVEPNPQTIVDALILDLEGISGLTGNDQKAVDAAIRQLRRSLSDQYWTSGSTLDEIDGDRVFDRWADAVAELKKIDTTVLSPDDFNTIFGYTDHGADEAGVIQTLTEAAEEFALEAVAHIVGSPVYDSAQQDLDKAYLDWNRTNPDWTQRTEENAIRDFRNAWRTATDALAPL
jgi:hypothetical protein